ncbi:MAG: peptidoglycan DD-metalloendopeptidase family protein [Micromonosporaceae bacterium]
MTRLSLARPVVVAAAVLLASVASGSPALAAPPGSPPLAAPAGSPVLDTRAGAPAVKPAVLGKLLDRAAGLPGFKSAEAGDTRIQVNRRSGRWAFGTAVLLAPASEGGEPRDWLFLAERRDGRWHVSFDGEPAFGALSARAPMLSAREQRVLASHGGEPQTQTGNEVRTRMRLPWALGQSWTLLGGPHAWDAGSGPWSSLDLAGGDQRVLAARAGVAYTTCTGRILVYHGDGYTTRYYHLWDHINVDGASVGEGAFLGYTGTEVGCGGSARSRHVHFSLLRNGDYVAIARHIIGKWVFMNGGSQYQGYALHGSTRVNVGGTLYNYGVLGLTQGVVDANGGGTLNKRSGPGTGYPVVGSVADGTTVTISCSRNGTSHSGRWGTTALWNRLTDGTWVSDAYVYTGVSGPVNGWC